ncbi:MAG TPA: YceI family protein [Anaerolineae bacterium]
MKIIETKMLMRRDVLKVGFGLLAVGLLAACGAPAATVAPTNPAPTSAAAPASTSTVAATVASAATTSPATTSPTSASMSTQPAPVNGAVYQIDQANTKATFSIGEKLMGSPNTVVGTTSKVSGVITANIDNPANTKIGAIQIDASTFRTDSDMRNGAIQRFILQSNQSKNQFITFEPTSIDGLKAPISTGAAIPVKITGNLKIRDAVKPVTFDGTVTLKSDTQIEGDLKATVTRADFSLSIPNVPSVADVTDEVKLELAFVATKQ